MSAFPIAGSLPLAAGGFDLLGVLVFIIFAIISAFSSRSRQAPPEEEEDGAAPGPARNDPPRQVPPPIQRGPVPSQTDLAEEMRRFLQEAQRQSRPQPSHPAPAQPSPRPRPTHTPVHAAPDPTLTRHPPPRKEPVFQRHQPPKLMPLDVQIRGAAIDEESSQDDDQPVAEPPEETGVRYQPPQPAPKFAPQFNRAMLGSPANLRQAIVAAEILGRPRGFDV